MFAERYPGSKWWLCKLHGANVRHFFTSHKDATRLEAIATRLEAIAMRLEAITTSNKKLLGLFFFSSICWPSSRDPKATTRQNLRQIKRENPSTRHPRVGKTRLHTIPVSAGTGFADQ